MILYQKVLFKKNNRGEGIQFSAAKLIAAENWKQDIDRF